MTTSAQQLDGYLQRLIVHLREQVDGPLDPNAVKPETTLTEELGIGSLQAVSFVMDIEEEFDITIEDAELATLETVGDVLTLIASKTGSAPA